jgi:magnesium transporter
LIKRRNSIYLKHLLWPQQEVLEELQQAIKDFYKEEMDVYYDDLQYKFTKVQHAIYTIGENVESLANTYNALANMQTNSVISVLTVLTVMIGTMTLITGLYGMNVPLPGQGNVYTFVVILCFMLFLGIGGLLVAKRKGLR